MSIGLYLASINIARNILGLGFLCKYNRHMELLCHDTGNADPGCLDREDLVDLAVCESAFELLTDLHKKIGVHLVVQKTVYL